VRTPSPRESLLLKVDVSEHSESVVDLYPSDRDFSQDQRGYQAPKAADREGRDETLGARKGRRRVQSGAKADRHQKENNNQKKNHTTPQHTTTTKPPKTPPNPPNQKNPTQPQPGPECVGATAVQEERRDGARARREQRRAIKGTRTHHRDSTGGIRLAE